MTIGERAKKLMEEKGWNQNDLAENSGVSITQINRLINGVGYPSLRTLERVAKAFGKGLVIEFILGGFIQV